jgi:hypothetical protein
MILTRKKGRLFLFDIWKSLGCISSMPRHARLDIPGLLQHVIVRGIEKSKVFRDDQDPEMLRRAHPGRTRMTLIMRLCIVNKISQKEWWFWQ